MKSIISLKSIKFIALTTKTVVVIDFYRLTVSVDINENVIIDNYGIIDWFSDICFYRLHSSGRVSTEQVIVGCGWLEIWKFFLPFLHSSLVWNNLFLVKYMIDSNIVVELEIPIEKDRKGNLCRGERLELRAPVYYRANVMAAFHACVRFQQVFCSFYWIIFPKAEVICRTGKHSILALVTP